MPSALILARVREDRRCANVSKQRLHACLARLVEESVVFEAGPRRYMVVE